MLIARMLAVQSSEEREMSEYAVRGWKSVLASRESTEYAPPHAYPPCPIPTMPYSMGPIPAMPHTRHAPHPICLIPYYSLTMCFMTTRAVKVSF